MTATTQMTKFPQWRGAHCLVAGQGREPSLLLTEKQVCLAASTSSQGCFKTNILTFCFFWISIPYAVHCCCFCVFWLVVSRFGFQDSNQAHPAPWAHTVRDRPSVSSQYNSQKHLLAHRAFPHTHQREWVQLLSLQFSLLYRGGCSTLNRLYLYECKTSKSHKQPPHILFNFVLWDSKNVLVTITALPFTLGDVQSFFWRLFSFLMMEVSGGENSLTDHIINVPVFFWWLVVNSHPGCIK